MPFSTMVAGVVENVASSQNDQGGSILSIVGRNHNSEIIVGDQARRYQFLHPSSVVCRVPDRVRSTPSQPVPEQERSDIHTECLKEENPRIRIGEHEVSSLELLVDLLIAVRHQIERKHSAEEIFAWIAVPSNRNLPERQTIAAAAFLAGLTKVHLVSMCAAQALSVLSAASADVSSRVCIIDLGWGQATFSCAHREQGQLIINESKAIPELGGYFWDQCFEKFFLEQASEQTGLDLKDNVVARIRIRDAVEKTRLALSESEEYQVHLPYIIADESGPKHVDLKIRRTEFESTIAALVMKTIDETQLFCEQAKLSLDDCQDIILTGGFSHLPIVRQQFVQRFRREPRLKTTATEGVLGGLVEIAKLHANRSPTGEEGFQIIWENEPKDGIHEIVQVMDLEESLKSIDAGELESLQVRLRQQQSEHEDSLEVARAIAKNRSLVVLIEAWLSESTDLQARERQLLESIATAAKKIDENSELPRLRYLAEEIANLIEQIPDSIRNMFESKVLSAVPGGYAVGFSEEKNPLQSEKDPERQNENCDITQNNSIVEFATDVVDDTTDELRTSDENKSL